MDSQFACLRRLTVGFACSSEVVLRWYHTPRRDTSITALGSLACSCGGKGIFVNGDVRCESEALFPQGVEVGYDWMFECGDEG